VTDPEKVSPQPIPSVPVLLTGPDGRIGRFIFSLPFWLAIAAGIWWLSGHEDYGSEAVFTVLAGAVFGITLQRSRFCFFCIIREALQERKFEGIFGIFVALGVGLVGCTVVFQGWIFEPQQAGFLPPGAHIGPVGWPLVMGSFIFGLGMSLSGSCLSAHFYRLGEGSILSPFAILGAFIGFGVGFQGWNYFYLRAYQDAPVLWLPQEWGYGIALVAAVGLMVVLSRFFYALRQREAVAEGNPRGDNDWYFPLWEKRWPTWVGGVIIGTLATYLTLQTEPLGVTAELGRLARDAGSLIGLLPDRLEGLDGFRGCTTGPAENFFSSNALFVLSLIAGSFAASFLGGHFEVERQPPARFVLAFLGGILLGFGAMISLGCTLGTLFSGITAGAVSGWVFFAGCVFGIAVGLPLRRLLGWR
jgi:uncharacterized membrane protein YedE/YeeE